MDAAVSGRYRRVLFLFPSPQPVKKSPPSRIGPAVDMKLSSTKMDLSFHALVWQCVAQAHFVFPALGGHFVPRHGGSAPAVYPHRGSVQIAIHPITI